MSESKKRTLYHALTSFEIYGHYSVDRLVKRDGTNIPFMIWPDGSPCLLANLYMLSLRDRKGRGGRQGLSRRGSKGGTMGEYAAKLSQLVRLCHERQVNITELNDANFSDFIVTLRKAKSEHNPDQPKKTENTLIATGKIWLDFLTFVGRLIEDKNFVSSEGNIRATEHTYTITGRNGRKISRSYLHHHSFGPESRVHRRNPITSTQTEKLKKAISNSKSSNFVKTRQRCMIELFNHTGARRSEVGNIMIADVLAAYEMEFPLLRLETLKQGDSTYRFIPVTKMLLHDIKNFIQTSRRKCMNKVYRDGPDHGYLFISEITGRKLGNETLSNEILTLRKQAGIKEQVCAHMFRHAFITNLFALFIQRHKMENSDDFQRALLDSHTFLAEITQWTGHLEPSSLETYINLAFKSLTNYSSTLTSVHLVKAIQVFDEKQNELIELLENGLPLSDYKIRLAQLIALRDEDFEAARGRTPPKL